MATPEPGQFPDWANNDDQLNDGTPNKVAPPQAKSDHGWEVGEFPPAQWFNYVMNLVGRWIRNLKERVTDLEDRVNTVESDTVPQATTERVGTVEMATEEEAIDGSNNGALALNPATAAAQARRIVSNAFVFQSGQVTTANRVSQNRGKPTDDQNVAYVFPPEGRTMSDLLIFQPTIAEVTPQGDTRSILYCEYTLEASRIRINCNNNENRSDAKVNYIGIWSAL